VCTCVWDFYGVVWLEGCKIRVDQGSLKSGLKNKVVRMFIWGLSCVGCDWLQVVEVVWMTVGNEIGARLVVGSKRKKSHINGLEFL
jgi:hypothetical protein